MTSIDLRDFLDEHGEVPPAVERAAERYGTIVQHASMRLSGKSARIPIRCRRRPNRRACQGYIMVYRQDAPPCVRWACPECEDNGVITGWEDTMWDFRPLVGAAGDDGEPIVLPLDVRTVLPHFASMSMECMAIAYTAVVENDHLILLVPNSLAGAFATHALSAALQCQGGVTAERLLTLATTLGANLSEDSLLADLGQLHADEVDDILAGFELIDGPIPVRSPELRAKRSHRPADARTYRIKVTLRDVKPPVWRRLLVPADLDLDSLHEAIQATMGWQGHHLHGFRIGDRTFSPRHAELEPIGEDSWGVMLSEVAPQQGSRLAYDYDFGDDWEHTVVVEAILDEPCTAPRCLGGRRACPPEDCGGIWGYQHLLEVIADPRHEEHESLLEWVGGSFDPEEFDSARCDAALRRALAHLRS